MLRLQIIAPSHLPYLCIFETGSLTGLELAKDIMLSGHQAPEALLSLLLLCLKFPSYSLKIWPNTPFLLLSYPIIKHVDCFVGRGNEEKF